MFCGNSESNETFRFGGQTKTGSETKLSTLVSVLRKGVVAKLRRSLYGLKQAPRAWFDKFQDTLIHLDFHPSSYNPSTFLHHAFTGITVLVVYVDDIIINGTIADMIH